jgi:hypothetical protein
MSPLVDRVRDALAFGAGIRFLTPSPEVAALGPEVLARATDLYAAHLAALAPFATGPLPVARVEAHARAVP